MEELRPELGFGVKKKKKKSVTAEKIDCSLFQQCGCTRCVIRFVSSNFQLMERIVKVSE